MLSHLPRLSLLATALLAVLYSASPASAQATRTWVSGVGNDANPCSRTAPCQTFSGAISKTADKGEINCLDPHGFGAVTIAKSITIDCNGTLGHILGNGVTGVTVNGAGINVVLRNLSMNGVTAGTFGVRFIAGNSLTLENVHIANFNGAGGGAGVQFSPNSANAVLLVSNSFIRSNGIAPSTGGGIVVQPAAGGTNALAVIHNSTIQRNGGSGILVNTASATATVTVRDSTITNNTNGGIRNLATSSAIMLVDRTTIASNSAFGVSSENANSTVRIGNSVVHANAQGMQTVNSGVIHSYKNNDVIGNGGSEGPFTAETPQ